MKRIILIFIFLLLVSIGKAQYWMKTYGTENYDQAVKIVELKDGNYLLAANTYPAITLSKIDPTGHLQETKYINPKRPNDSLELYDMIFTKDGGVMLTGEYYNEDEWDEDIFVIKLDRFAEIQWYKIFGGSYWDSGEAIAELDDGNYIIAARSSSFLAHYALLLFKIDINGNFIWQKAIDVDYCIGVNDIASAKNGEFVIVMNYCGQFYIIKFNSFGNFIWQKAYSRGDDYAFDIKYTNDGGFIVAAKSYINGYKLWILKINSLGDIAWQKFFPIELGWGGLHIAIDYEGNYLIFAPYKNGYYNDIILIKLDKTGKLRWSKRYGGYYDEIAKSMIITSDRSILLAGETESFGAGNSDVLILKLNYNGQIGDKCSYEKEVNIKYRDTKSEVSIENRWIGVINVTVKEVELQTSVENYKSTSECKAGESFWIECQPNYLPYLLRISKCTIHSFSNYSGFISFSCSDIPNQAECIFSPPTAELISGSSISTKLALKINNPMEAGIHYFNVVATSGYIKRSYSLKFEYLKK